MATASDVQKSYVTSQIRTLRQLVDKIVTDRKRLNFKLVVAFKDTFDKLEFIFEFVSGWDIFLQNGGR